MLQAMELASAIELLIIQRSTGPSFCWHKRIELLPAIDVKGQFAPAVARFLSDAMLEIQRKRQTRRGKYKAHVVAVPHPNGARHCRRPQGSLLRWHSKYHYSFASIYTSPCEIDFLIIQRTGKKETWHCDNVRLVELRIDPFDRSWKRNRLANVLDAADP